MKKLFGIIIFSIIIGFVPVPILAQTGFDPSALSSLTLPQPESVIVANMIEPEPTPAPISFPSQDSIFGQLLELSPAPPQVLGQTAPVAPAPSQTRTTRQNPVTIVIVGDSMVDTMGTGLPYLNQELIKIYPATQFNLFNYGIGSTNIDTGLARLASPLDYHERQSQSVIALNPDLVIIESFAYNPLPLSDANLNHHRDQLASMVNLLRSQTQAQVMLLATIAPHHTKFGTGVSGVNWSQDSIAEHTTAIHAYLENTVTAAQELNVPLIDAFHASQDGSGNGRDSLISPGDHIHPSVLGHQFLAQTITDKIIALNLLE